MHVITYRYSQGFINSFTTMASHAQRLAPKPSKWFASTGLRISRKSSSFSKSTSASTSPISTSPSPTRRSTTKEEELRQVFNRFDGDRDGKISALELRAYFGSIGEYMSHEAALAAIQELDTDGDDFLDFQDFLKLMMTSSSSSSSSPSSSGGDDDDDLRMAFEMFEYEKGCGCITPKGLQRMLHKLGDNKSYEDCVSMIRFYDADGHGVLDFNEFHQMMA